MSTLSTALGKPALTSSLVSLRDPTPAHEVGLRERKKRETRFALLEAALELAVELGPESVTVEAIASRANVSVRTFFNYFPSREDALAGVDPDKPAELIAALDAVPRSPDPLADLLTVFLARVPHLSAHASMWQARSQLFDAHPELHARHAAAFSSLEATLTRALAARLDLPENSAYPALLAGAALLGLRTGLRVWAHTPEAELGACVREAFALLSAGLRPPR